MTTSTPVRAIKARARSRADQTVARRAIEEPPAPPAPRTTPVQNTARPAVTTGENAFVGPRIGKPETQLALSFLATAAIVFVFTVVLPLLLRLVRNF
ncbi:MAG: hypothetical protein LWW77_05165 [Propionibacteriales bacterium]|nr:hypothetical protein [Propionibacteriales bacterium]